MPAATCRTAPNSQMRHKICFASAQRHLLSAQCTVSSMLASFSTLCPFACLPCGHVFPTSGNET